MTFYLLTSRPNGRPLYNQHFRYAAEAYNETAEYHGQGCMCKAKAECVKRVIEKEMREAYFWQAYAAGGEWDDREYGDKVPGTHGKSLFTQREYAGRGTNDGSITFL